MAGIRPLAVVQVARRATAQIVKLLLLKSHDVPALMFHLVEAFEKLLALELFGLVEGLHHVLDLGNAVDLESFRFDRVHQLVDSVVKDLDVLFDLLVA